jgi:septal ring factor EnvC (AmiA/AmiB activator)
MELENLKLLETKIDQFVDHHERVREAHDVLVQRLQQRELELAELTGQVKQYEQERVELRARLERILSRLNALDLA